MAAPLDSLLSRMDPNDFDEDTRSDADEQDEGDMSDMENPSECDVKPLFVNDLDPLVCQNNDCGGPLKVPIKQCLAGHLFCSNCHQGEVNCMLCEENKLFAAPSVDAILNTIMDVCPFKICNKQLPFYQLEDHVEGCGYFVTCPIPPCSEVFVSRLELDRHLTKIHETHVDSFQFGVPVRFAFGMHHDTRALIESSTKNVFVVHYEVGADATLFKFFCINSFGDPEFTYRIVDQNGKSALLAESKVPTTAPKEGASAIDFGGSLSHELRTGDELNDLHCSFVITVNREPEN